MKLLVYHPVSAVLILQSMFRYRKSDQILLFYHVLSQNATDFFFHAIPEPFCLTNGIDSLIIVLYFSYEGSIFL